MLSKYHHVNSDFQIMYFLVGSCHTADAAYFLLLDLKENREMAVEAYQVSLLKNKAKRLRLEERLSLFYQNEADYLEDLAALKELDYNEPRSQLLYQETLNELKFINNCIEKVNNKRKLKHLSNSEAAQEMQREEWKLELLKRAQNSLLTTGTIPTDQFDTMRMHPDFIEQIFPSIEKMRQQLSTKEGVNLLISQSNNLLE